MIRRALLALALGALATGAVEHTGPPEAKELPAVASDPLHGLPVPAKPVAEPAADLGHLEELVPGVRIARGTAVVLDGTINIDQGPPDGLEVFACLKDGKTHEALIKLATSQGQVVKAACIAALGLADGQPADEGSGQPSRGTPVTLTVRWRDGTTWKQIAASSLIRDRVVDRAYPALPWIYTGSRFQRIFQNGPDGRPQARDVFMLDSTRSIAVNYDEPDALIASPFPGAKLDVRFEAYSAICPPAGTPIELVIGRADLPVDLLLDAAGTLTAAGKALDDAALAAFLATLGQRPLRAVTVQPEAAALRAGDTAVRARILAAAAAAKAWLVPVFVSGP